MTIQEITDRNYAATVKRGQITDKTQAYNFTSKKNNDYLVLPIMVKYNFGNKNSFYANGGPFIGYLLKSIHQCP